MSRTYTVRYEVTYSVETEIDADDYDDLNDKLDGLRSGDIDSWDLDFPENVDINAVTCEEEEGRYGRYGTGLKEGPFEEDADEIDPEEDNEGEEKVEEVK